MHPWPRRRRLRGCLGRSRGLRRRLSRRFPRCLVRVVRGERASNETVVVHGLPGVSVLGARGSDNAPVNKVVGR
ncbi:hypothetical protein SXIM_27780 [Streptomyces xiamenensis]|uniref:Uncharacterized protein n=1 Tax=Streptomyces xiamenensis TaxID=408015 RepID=A0A0F7FUU1_9ACTN|nr:hypothetical protein SXIM_27780 [Streptomyces xiamenensis]